MSAQGSPLSDEARRLIVVLKHYFGRTRNDPKENKCTDIERVAHALDIGVATVGRVMANYNKDHELLNREPALRGRPGRVISDDLQTLTRDIVREANRNGRHLTLETLSGRLKQAHLDLDFSVRTLGRSLDRWGFGFGKGTRSQHLKEKDHVVAARHRYLRSKRANRNGTGVHRPEVYLDESYVNKNHSNDFIWYSEEDGPWVQKPTGKGERLILLNAITSQGWVPEAKLIFRSTRKTGDYHGQMNYGLFAKWFESQLLPNIPDSSIIIMDNAAYHNALSSRSPPTAACGKNRIRTWLQENNVTLQEDCLKVEMVEILNELRPQPIYAIDELAAKHGHTILRTPPYHPELQPIETCWAIAKNHVARNCDFTMANLHKQIAVAFESITGKTCSGLINNVRKTEDKFWEDDIQEDQEMSQTDTPSFVPRSVPQAAKNQKIPSNRQNKSMRCIM
jgi:transposase